MAVGFLFSWLEVSLAMLCKTATHEQKQRQSSCEQTDFQPVSRWNCNSQSHEGCEREHEKEGSRQKWEQILPFLKVTQKVWTFHWFQMKQKFLSWNYRERGCFPFPFEIGSYQCHQKLCKHGAREQRWTRFIVNWGRKQVRMAFSLALPSFAMKGFQSSNYKSKLKLFCESVFEVAAILPFKAFPQPDSSMVEGWFSMFYKVGREGQSAAENKAAPMPSIKERYKHVCE